MRKLAFTLVELLVVIAIIVILVAILTPSMSQTIHVARDRICRDHLHHIGEIAHSNAANVGADPLSLLGSDAWVGPVNAVDKSILLCPEDPNNGVTVQSDDAELDKYYILQQEPGGTTFAISNLGAAFHVGAGILEDGQFWTNKPPTTHVPGAHPCYCKNPIPASNQVVAGICSEAIVVITTGQGGQMTFTSKIGCTAGPNKGSHSEHYLMKGSCTDPSKCLTTDTKIMRLGGETYTTADPAYSFNISATSYGMNDKIDCPTTNTHIPAMMRSPQQMMIMDANSAEIKIGEPDWMSHIFFRHFNKKVNYVTTGGAVQSINKGDLVNEYNRLEDSGEVGGSLLGKQATPIMKK